MNTLLLVCIGTGLIGAAAANDVTAGSAERREAALVRSILEPLASLSPGEAKSGPPSSSAAYDVSQCAKLVRTETFDEIWPGQGGQEKTIRVAAEIWTDAIQAAVNERGAAWIPRRDRPYYLDRPLVLRSGQRLIAAPAAEIRLKPGSNYCMVRNERMVDGQAGPVGLGDGCDHDIVVSGGIWSTLATSERQTNGNVGARADAKDSVRSHGVLLFSNVKRLVVSGVTLRQCKPHGVQISNCSEFRVEGVRFEDHRRDGVHVNGPASHGLIRDIRVQRGSMGDDMVALNGWDWMNTSMTFGPIHHVLVEDVDGEPKARDGHRSEIRLLAGTKRFGGGGTLDCNIEHCVFRGLTGIRTFKMYDQPNLELGRERDFAEPIGVMRDLWFSRVNISRPTGAAIFQIHSNVSGMTIRDVTLGFDPSAGAGEPFVLAQVGPLSQTFKFDASDPRRWVEIFSPDKDCVVEGLKVLNVRGAGREVKSADVVRVVQQTVNKDYPKTTPRGGTGRGVLR
ncbi:MAG: right-handed parallel beta-helix repeat-containing protein [Phycisphaerae bacterium]|nr:right-handed parallel beta-helix repeat-containing protein [Phycisphaerae bacterium]